MTSYQVVAFIFQICEICQEVLTQFLRCSTFSVSKLGPPPPSPALDDAQAEDNVMLGNGEDRSAGQQGGGVLSRSSAQALSLLAFKAVALTLRQVYIV